MKLFFVSLGCDKNLVDSEKMLALLLENEMEITEDAREAEVIIVNTCSFIHDAKQESIETILEMAEQKETGNCRVLIVTGCLAQRYAADIRKEIPEVDAVVGTTAYDEIASAVKRSLSGENVCILKEVNYLPEGLTRRLQTSSPHTAYLKIAEGCNKRCTYCIIPSLRGDYRSVPMEELTEEAALLAEGGTRELILIAQETTVYGVDIYGKKALPELLKRLCRIEGLRWIRLLYCYPEEITEELLLTMRKEEKICHYLDLPIQHCNDDILKRMGRRTNRADLSEKIKKIREILPDITLRTTLISGFPGETVTQHEECVQFVAQTEFERLGVFPYSPEEGTPAAEYENQIEENIKQQWADEIMEAEQNIIFRQNEKRIGKKLQVITDGYLPEEDIYVGRTYRDAPDIDGCVFFHAAHELLTGTFLTVIVTEARGYDLIGEICDEEDE